MGSSRVRYAARMDPHENVEVDGPELQLPETVLPGRSATYSLGRAEHDRQPASPPSEAPHRYEDRLFLGVGGMGEVRLCRDRVIGRDVAMKVIRDRDDRPERAADEAAWRFLREARVQGQLEHPAIVPVYDLGADAAGRMYFTMKCIRGASLADVLEWSKAGDEQASKRWTPRRLLSLFAQICTALEYAHSRGVVHRDLKPANLMLGGFGEVYVLDWGLARVGDEAERYSFPEGTVPGAPPAPDIVKDESDGSTVTGAMLGTPGYMAPEQLHAGIGEIGPRTDVYALGLVLFEILTLARVHAKAPLADRLVATLRDDGLSPALAAPERSIAPELDRICFDATRRRPEDRIASARELAERIEAYLDGDRDAVLRADMATRHAARARDALTLALEGGAGEAEHRATAMREVTLALGLAPEHEDARRTLVALLATPPREVPEQAHRRVKQRFAKQRRLLAWGALAHYVLVWLWVPVTIWMGIRDWPTFGLLGGTAVACAAFTGYLIWKRRERDERLPIAHLALTSLLVMLGSQFFGPLVFVPLFAIANQLAYVSAYSDRRWVVILASGLAMGVPTVASLLGWLPPFYDTAEGTLRILPHTLELPYLPTMLFVLTTHLAVLVMAGIVLGVQRDEYERGVLAVELQSWQLEQILPASARTTAGA
jgi:hypothetical protein